MTTLIIGLLSFTAAGVGALGGLGGAVLLVPALVVAGMEPSAAAPLGLLTVAAGSLSASSTQLDEDTVNHRLGVTLEVSASAAAAVGALASSVVSATALQWLLALAAIGAGIALGARRGSRYAASPESSAKPGERRGRIAGAYQEDGGVIEYEAHNVPAGVAVMGVAGLVAGMTGTSGGFIKTPVMNQLMRVPVKVAASTTVFMVGVTAASALIVYAAQGRIDPHAAGAVVVGGLAGGRAGALLQSHVPPAIVRRILAAVLIVVGIVLVVRT
ncbi:MAG TPA: TSUP family transporter [Euzebyales bacterium]